MSRPTDRDSDDLEAEPAEWYRAGLRFECTQCGNCCTGGPGAVWFSSEEGRAMAAALGVSDEEFLARFTRTIGRRRSLTEVPSPHGLDCVFLDRVSEPGRALCRVYAARPSQCRTWPFWGENLASREAWESAKRRTPCPGMGSGRTYALVEIRVALDLDRRGELRSEARDGLP